jgi:hypothetical protein
MPPTWPTIRRVPRSTARPTSGFCAAGSDLGFGCDLDFGEAAGSGAGAGFGSARRSSAHVFASALEQLGVLAAITG